MDLISNRDFDTWIINLAPLDLRPDVPDPLDLGIWPHTLYTCDISPPPKTMDLSSPTMDLPLGSCTWLPWQWVWSRRTMDLTPPFLQPWTWPLSIDRITGSRENITFPRTTYEVGNEHLWCWLSLFQINSKSNILSTADLIQAFCNSWTW